MDQEEFEKILKDRDIKLEPRIIINGGTPRIDFFIVGTKVNVSKILSNFALGRHMKQNNQNPSEMAREERKRFLERIEQELEEEK